MQFANLFTEPALYVSYVTLKRKNKINCWMLANIALKKAFIGSRDSEKLLKKECIVDTEASLHLTFTSH